MCEIRRMYVVGLNGSKGTSLERPVTYIFLIMMKGQNVQVKRTLCVHACVQFVIRGERNTEKCNLPELNLLSITMEG